MKQYLLALFLAITSLLGAQAIHHERMSFMPQTLEYSYMMDAIRCSNGDYVMVGEYLESQMPQSGYRFIVRTDSNMNIIWKTKFNCAVATEGMMIWHLGENNRTGGFYLFAEEMHNAPVVISYPWLIEFDSSGALSWARRYDTGAHASGMSGLQLSDGRFAIQHQSAAGAGIIYADSAGNPLQQVNYQQWVHWLCEKSVAGTRGDFRAVAGHGQSMSVVRIDSTGQPAWCKVYQHPHSYHVREVKPASNGCLLVAGSYYDPMQIQLEYPFIMKMDSNGVILWRKVWTDTSTSYGIRFEHLTEGADGTITTVARHVMNGGPSIISHFDANGNVLSSVRLRNPQGEYYQVQHIHATPGGQLIMPAVGPSTMVTWTQTAVFILADSSGDFGCVSEPYPLMPYTMTAEQLMSNPTIPTGTFPVTVFTCPFSVDSVTYLHFYNDCYNTTVFGPAAVGSIEDRQVNISPNPAIDALHVTSDYALQRVRIYDVQGRLQMEYMIHGMQTDINVASLTEGVYVLELTTEKGIIRRRFVKE